MLRHRAYLRFGWTECVQHCQIPEKAFSGRSSNPVWIPRLCVSRLHTGLTKFLVILYQMHYPSTQSASIWKLWSTFAIEERRTMRLLWRYWKRFTCSQVVPREKRCYLPRIGQPCQIHDRGYRSGHSASDGRIEGLGGSLGREWRTCQEPTWDFGS